MKKSFSITEALANDNKPKSTEKSESKAAENMDMEPKQSEQQPTMSTAESAAAAIPLSCTSDTNMDDNHNNNTNTTSPSPPSTTNEDKNNEGDGVKAPKRGRQKSVSLADEEMLVSPPQKKPASEVNKGMEAEKRAIFQSPSFYNNYAGYAFPHPHAYDHPSWSPMLSGPPSSPTPIMLSQSPFQEHKFGWFRPPPIPVATSTPLNPAFECSTSSQMDSSMMDVQKETSWELSVSGEAENEQSRTDMDLSNSMEDQSNDYERNGPTSSGESSTVGPQLTMLMPMQKMPITPRPQFGTPHSMLYPPPFGHPFQLPYRPYSTGHLPMPVYQENQVQPIIIQNIKQENAEDAKDGIYRECLVCGDNDYACGKYTATALQVCKTCREFFKRMVETGSDQMHTFKCSQGPANCIISKDTRNWCKFCRFQACLKVGMDRQRIIELKAKREKKKNGSGTDN